MTKNNWNQRSDGSFINNALTSKKPLTKDTIGEAKDFLSSTDDKKNFLIYLLKRIAENTRQDDEFLKENIEFAIFLLKYPDKELRDAAISTIKSFASNGVQTYGETLILQSVKEELTKYIKETVEKKVEESENKDEEKQKIRKLIEQKLESDNKGTIRRDIREALGFPSEGKNWSQKLLLNVICDKNNVLGIIDTLLDSISPKPEVVQERESSRSSSDHGNDNHEESGGVGDVVPDNSHKRGCFAGFSLSSLCSVQVPHIDDDQEQKTSNALVTGENEGLDAGAQEQKTSNALVTGENEGLDAGAQEEETSNALVTGENEGLDAGAQEQKTSNALVTGENEGLDAGAQEEETSNALVTGENEGLDAGAQEEETSNALVTGENEGLDAGAQEGEDSIREGNQSTVDDGAIVKGVGLISAIMDKYKAAVNKSNNSINSPDSQAAVNKSNNSKNYPDTSPAASGSADKLSPVGSRGLG